MSPGMIPFTKKKKLGDGGKGILPRILFLSDLPLLCFSDPESAIIRECDSRLCYRSLFIRFGASAFPDSLK